MDDSLLQIKKQQISQPCWSKIFDPAEQTEALEDFALPSSGLGRQGLVFSSGGSGVSVMAFLYAVKP